MNIAEEFDKEKEIAEKFYKVLEFKCFKRIPDDFLNSYKPLKEIKEYLKDPKEKKWGIYIIYVEKPINYSAVETAYNEAKEDGYCMSRAPENTNEEKSCLYVGSSQNVYNRLKKHVGWKGSYKKEYALHMDQWLKDNKVRIELYDMDPEILETIGPDSELMSNELKMQLIEDIFWSVQKPLFGKKGGK